MSFGLCLAGGGIKGAAHIGAIKALEEKNIKIDYISGTSSGSIVATLYAVGYSSDEIYTIFKKYAHKIKSIDFINIFKCIYGLVVYRKIIIRGLNSGRTIEKIINKVCAEKGIVNINEVRMPLLIPSVDLHTGEVYVFKSGNNRAEFSDKIKEISDISIGKAVRASCSYPGVFEPCKYETSELVDGGIRENIPWKGIKQMGAEKVLGVMFPQTINEECCESVVEVIGNSFDILCHELSNYEIDGVDYLLKIKSPKVGLLDTKKLDLLYNIGYQQMKKYLMEKGNEFK